MIWSLVCRLNDHVWEEYEKNPHREGDHGTAARCVLCGTWDWDHRSPGQRGLVADPDGSGAIESYTTEADSQ